MLLALIIEAFKISVMLGGIFLCGIIAVNVFHILITRVIILPVVFVILLSSLIHKSYLALTSQTDKLRHYYG